MTEKDQKSLLFLTWLKANNPQLYDETIDYIAERRARKGLSGGLSTATSSAAQASSGIFDWLKGAASAIPGLASEVMTYNNAQSQAAAQTAAAQAAAAQAAASSQAASSQAAISMGWQETLRQYALPLAGILGFYLLKKRGKK